MAMKFDKDMLVKQRFWVLLGVTVPLVLVAVFVLITSVSADIENKRKKAAEKFNTLTKINKPSGPKVIEFITAEAETFKKSETEVHANAFNAQAPLFYWAKAVEDRFNFHYGWFTTEVKIITAPANKDSWPADDSELYHGQVTAIDPDSLVVKGKEGKEARFQRTAKIKVSKQDKKDNEKEQWQTISRGDFVAVSYYRSKYFFDLLTDHELTEFAKSYKSQIHPILRMIDPVDDKGAGTVQLKGWPYKKNDFPPAQAKFFTYVSEPWNDANDFSEEAWLAQEDLWIQRELFRIIRAANDSVAICAYRPQPQEKQPVTDKNFEDKSRPLVFANPNYELKFEWLDANRLALTVKNQLPRRQKLDVHFRVKFNKSDNPDLSTELLLVDGEPLDPFGMAKDSHRKEFTLEKNQIKRVGIFGVEQALTWETAAVKRIDATSIGSPAADIAHGHKTFPQGSKPYRKEEKKEDQKSDNPMGGLGTGGAPPSALGSGGGPRGSGGFGGQGAADAARGPNGVLKDRYLEVSEQSRRVPVGLALIIDQDHIGRVLNAFNNSKLRFLTTQVLLNRYSASVRPPVAGGPGDLGSGVGADIGGQVPSLPPSALGGGGPRGGSMNGPPGGGSSSGPPMGTGIGGKQSPMPGGVGPTQPQYGVGPMGATNPGAYASAAAAGASEEMENNVELVIYGIVTLYERYPKRKADVK